MTIPSRRSTFSARRRAGGSDRCHPDKVVPGSMKGVGLSQDIFPTCQTDPYRMAIAASIWRSGPDRDGYLPLDAIALLDNFCWCSSDEPEALANKQAAFGCRDGAIAFGTPYIGKDSMYNVSPGSTRTLAP